MIDNLHEVVLQDCTKVFKEGTISGASVLRLDLMDKFISGNKYFKLKYNLEKAISQGHRQILTFGGAYSNHIAATASACNKLSLNSIGIIRGEKPKGYSDTLKRAQEHGMNFKFVSREQYRNKNSSAFTEEVLKEFGEYYTIPEGGANDLGVKGASEILLSPVLTDYLSGFTHLVCPVGTGTTWAGLCCSALPHQQVMGILIHKGLESVLQLINQYGLNKSRVELISQFHFNGYAKYNPELLAFINQINFDFGIPLDFVYTGKMFYAIKELCASNYFQPNSNLLLIHTGGLQGNRGIGLEIN